MLLKILAIVTLVRAVDSLQVGRGCGSDAAHRAGRAGGAVDAGDGDGRVGSWLSPAMTGFEAETNDRNN